MAIILCLNPKNKLIRLSIKKSGLKNIQLIPNFNTFINAARFILRLIPFFNGLGLRVKILFSGCEKYFSFLEKLEKYEKNS